MDQHKYRKSVLKRAFHSAATYAGVAAIILGAVFSPWPSTLGLVGPTVLSLFLLLLAVQLLPSGWHDYEELQGRTLKRLRRLRAKLKTLRDKQVTKETRRALEGLIDKQIDKGKVLIEILGAEDRNVINEAYRECDPWRNQTHNLLSEALGKPTADRCLRRPEDGSRYQGSKRGLIKYNIMNLYDLIADSHNWDIREEYIESLTSGP